MQLIINIEKKHFVILMVAISFLGLFMLGNAADVDVNDAWHPLQQIAKSESDTTSVDSDNNNQIDWADNASYAYGIEWDDIDSRPAGLDDGDQYLPDDPATSDVDMNGNVITNLADPNNPQDGATKNYVDSNDPDPTNELQTLSKSGDTISLSDDGSVTLNDDDPTNEIQNLNNVLSEGNWAGYQRIRGLSDPTNGRDAATKQYVDTEVGGGDDRYLPDDPATSNVNMNGNKIRGLGTPTQNSDAATKKYADNILSNDGEFDVDADNENENTKYASGSPSFCFLNNVKMQDGDGRCSVYGDGGWHVEAKSYGDYVKCDMKCYSIG